MKGNNLDKQFNDKALPPIQDLSKQYKKNYYKRQPIKKQPSKVKTLKTLAH